MAYDRTTIQKLSLAGMVIAGMMVIVGAVAPYWLVFDPQLGGGVFGKIETAIAQGVAKTVMKANIGLVVACVEVKFVGNDCKVIDSDNGAFHAAWVFASGCVFLGGTSGMISLCLACCSCCRRFVCLGITAFLGAASGAVCVINFTSHADVYTTNIAGFSLFKYGWAMYVFCGGVAILGVTSFAACFAAPKTNVQMQGMVLGTGQPSVQVSMQSSQNTTVGMPYAHLQEDFPRPLGNPALGNPAPGNTMVNNPITNPVFANAVDNGY